MVQAGIGLDTPRTNLGDATYLTNQPEFDISQEQSFQSPSKDNNDLLQQLQNGRRGAINLKTPRTRVPFSNRQNLPNGLAGGEFTPLLKSATRNSALKFGKENGVPQTPAFLKPGGLDNIAEDLSPVPQLGSSIYEDSRNGSSYVNGTPVPQIDSSSAASTPMALLPRRSDGSNVLQGENQLSLREQENIIDKIEKENFGLKLKIHFLEEALRKAGPGFSEAALKENTELKVDKVTMQKELHRYRKILTTAERDLETYRQQIIEMQEKAKRRHADEGAREELERLRQALEDKELEIQEFSNKLKDAEKQDGLLEKLRDEMGDLEADLREKDRVINDREDELEDLQTKIRERDEELAELEESLKSAKRREMELEEKAQAGEEMEEARETIAELEQDIKRLTQEIEEAKEDQQEAVTERDRATADLQELQDEMANKSITTKGLSRQIEEKANRLQDELEDLKEAHSSLEQKLADKVLDFEALQEKLQRFEREAEEREKKLQKDLDLAQSQLQSMKDDLQRKVDEKDLLQVRHDALTSESADLQKDLAKARHSIEDLEDKLDEEKTLALRGEREVRDEYKTEIDRLNDELEDLRAEVREKERIHDNESDKWESERRKLESDLERAEEQAAGLQRTIDKLQESEGTLSGKEMKLQEAFDSEKERFAKEKAALTGQIDNLNADLQSRQTALEEARSDLSTVREELRLSQREQKSLLEKIEGLEDEIEVMQTTLDDESDRAKAELDASREEAVRLSEQLQRLRLGSDDDLRSQEELSSKLRVLEPQLDRVRKEKQELQDQLAHANIEKHSLQAKTAEIEAERDELKSQLKELKQQEDTFRLLDQEKIELRTSKMKLDNEVRRLREEGKILTEQNQLTEKQLQEEIERASGEELRLMANISELQKKLTGTPNKDLITAKHTIQRLELQVQDLELQIRTTGNNPHADTSSQNHEISLLRRDLSSARQKEIEYLSREASQKDTLRTLKKQVADLERRAHDAEISHLQTTSNSPRSTSASDSARKSEIIEVRHQLATAHQQLKDLRSQLKDSERDAARKISALTLEHHSASAAWESDRFAMETELQQAVDVKNDLLLQNAAAEQTIARLRGKIERLEKEVSRERARREKNHRSGSGFTSGGDHDNTMALERHDLHEMLKDAQLQAEELDLVVKARDTALKRLDREFRTARLSWEEEKRSLTRGVRFPNMSVSDLHASSLIRSGDVEEREKRHVKELRGLAMQIEWLRARVRREEALRADAAYAKRFMLLQIELFGACNKADLHILSQIGITPNPAQSFLSASSAVTSSSSGSKKPSLRTVAFLVKATIRMQRGAAQWAKSRKVHERLVGGLEGMRRAAAAAAAAGSGNKSLEWKGGVLLGANAHGYGHGHGHGSEKREKRKR